MTNAVVNKWDKNIEQRKGELLGSVFSIRMAVKKNTQRFNKRMASPDIQADDGYRIILRAPSVACAAFYSLLKCTIFISYESRQTMNHPQKV